LLKFASDEYELRPSILATGFALTVYSQVKNMTMQIPQKLIQLNATFIFLCLTASFADAEAFKLRVVDDHGQDVPKFQIMLEPDTGLAQWHPGVEGITVLEVVPKSGTELKSLQLVVRADGFASKSGVFTGDELTKLLQGKTILTLAPGNEVELKVHFPEQIELPTNFFPEVYPEPWQSRIRSARVAIETHIQMASRLSAVNRRLVPPEDPPVNLLNVQASESKKFTLRLAPDSASFNVGVHCPGVVRDFDAGPFTAANVKDGVLMVEVPQPASLDVNLDLAGEVPSKAFQSCYLYVRMQHPNGNIDNVATQTLLSEIKPLHLTDLPAGTYTITMLATPARSASVGDAARARPFRFNKQVSLQFGEKEKVEIHYAPPDPNAFRGTRSAVVHIDNAAGQPAARRKAQVLYLDPSYGALPVYSGDVSETGDVVLDNITEGSPRKDNGDLYEVIVDRLRVGGFHFTSDEGVEHVSLRCPPVAGDMAPDFTILDIANGTTTKPSDLRGKFVLLDFWATWCGPCQPALEKLDKDLAEHTDEWKDKLVVIPVSIDEVAEDAKQHLAARDWTHLHAYWTGEDGKVGWKSPGITGYAITAIPHSILIGPDGKIIWRGHPMAADDGPDLSARIEAALK
jgi:thiol-disulfide isomerase/thioredoxin